MKLKCHCKSWRERLKGIEEVKQSGAQDKDIKSLSAPHTWYVNKDGLIRHVYVHDSTDRQFSSLYMEFEARTTRHANVIKPIKLNPNKHSKIIKVVRPD